MKVIYFIVINIIVLVAICGINMYAFINNIEFSNGIYLWVVLYAFVIGCSIIGMNCRNQILRLEELMSVKLSMDPTDEEAEELLKLNLEDDEEIEEQVEQEQEEQQKDESKSKKKFFKKRA